MTVLLGSFHLPLFGYAAILGVCALLVAMAGLFSRIVAAAHLRALLLRGLADAMIALRSLLFNVAFYVESRRADDPRPAGAAVRAAWRVLHGADLGGTSIWLLDKICGLQVEFRGLENIPQGGYILAAKHQSFLETFALVTKTPDFAIILKKQLMYIPFFGLYLSAGGQIGIDRSKGRSALAQIIEQAGAGAARRAAGLHLSRRHAAGARRGAGLQTRRRRPLRGDAARRACRWRSTPACSGGGAASCAGRGRR